MTAMTEKQIRDSSYRGRYIPEHMIGAVLRYFNDHSMPGDFLCALLVNDFMAACRRADDKNMAALPAWAAFLYNEAPSKAYGSPKKFKAWLAMRQDS